MLDDLIGVIETIQGRIQQHGQSLRENETRTRMALIDPLLMALGWDVADPGLVMPEYSVSGNRADYALLKPNGHPAATVEAKKLGEGLESHRMQMLNYSNASGVDYAGITDGNRWELYDVFKRGQLDDRRVLDVTIADTPTHRCALELLLLWRPNLASGEPVAANEPVLSAEQATPDPQPANIQPAATVPPQPPSNEEWTSLAEFSPKSGGKFPSEVRFPGGETRQIRFQNQLLIEVSEFLVRSGKLTAAACPIESGPRRYLVNIQKIHKDNQRFQNSHQLTNGLFLETSFPAPQTANGARVLLDHFRLNASEVWIKFN